MVCNWDSTRRIEPAVAYEAKGMVADVAVSREVFLEESEGSKRLTAAARNVLAQTPARWASQASKARGPE